jgi:hypothetical protein
MMTARYRLLQYVTDPFAGTRVPFAAIVRQGGILRTTRAQHIPGPDCVGGAGAGALLRAVSELLDQVTSFDDLPGTFGPHFTLSEPWSVPAEVVDAVDWIRSNVLPRKIAEATAERRGEIRSTQGYAYLERAGVARYVKKRFAASRLFGASHLAPISHYVGDPARTLLLMEPLVTTHSHFDADLTKVETNLGAYRFRSRSGGAQSHRAHRLRVAPDRRTLTVRL